jgi:hypothetical protein
LIYSARPASVTVTQEGSMCWGNPCVP